MNTTNPTDIATAVAHYIDASESVIERVTEMIRRNAERRREHAEGRPARTFVPPPPVASHLRGFADSLADKVELIAAKLDVETRERLVVLAPEFKRAVFANDPDVMGLVLWAIAEPPQGVAEYLTLMIDDLEGWLAP